MRETSTWPLASPIKERKDKEQQKVFFARIGGDFWDLGLAG